MSYPRENIISGTSAQPGVANTAAVAALPAATTNHRWRVRRVFGGYTATPTGGLLTITDGTTTFEIPITTAVPFDFPNLDFQTVAGATPSATLAAGSGAVVGYVNLYGTLE